MTNKDRQVGDFERLGRRIDEAIVNVPRFVLGRVERTASYVMNLPPDSKMHLAVILGAVATAAVAGSNVENITLTRDILTIGGISTVAVAGLVRVISGIH